jgi:cupin superfamily acireductone dioxygenase involved in methionine salvage
VTRQEFHQLARTDDLPSVPDLIRLFLHLVEDSRFVTEDGWVASYHLKDHARKTLAAMGEQP